MLISDLISQKAKVNQFNKKNIYTTDDLLQFAPRKYYDFSKISDASLLHDGDMATIYGQIVSLNVKEARSTGKEMVIVTLRTKPNGYYVTMLLFNQGYKANQFAERQWLTICGKVSVRVREVTMINPILTIYSNQDDPCLPGIYPVYSKIQGMADQYLQNTIDKALEFSLDNDYLPDAIRNAFKLPSRKNAYVKLHHPMGPNDPSDAKRRITFDSLLYYNTMLYHQNDAIHKQASWKFKGSSLPKQYVKSLPYDLTLDQKKAITKIVENGSKGINEKLLVIGDVGYGKTEIAKISALYAVEEGYQVALMAPTQILATQHYYDFSKSFESLGVKCALLHSKLKKRERSALLKQLKDGEIKVLISTHSVVSEEVEFQNLGMMIVDEEHRFGVKVREAMVDKYPSIYHISMSATPIPRTLAMGLYGLNIAILPIKTAPSNRKPVKTIWAKRTQEYDKVESTLSKGQQVYVVCPSIEENEDVPMVSVEDIYASYITRFPNAKVARLTGKMKSEEADEVLQKFKDGEIQILIATTVIEVGVNVPNATLIVIEDADRFGLAQLHQLRGRVGRSNTIKDQATCYLITSDQYNEVPPRLQIMLDSNDGFKIAEYDLKERGSGNWIGTEQSGMNKYIDLIMAFPKLNDAILKLVKHIAIKDPELLRNIELANQ